MGPGNTDVNGEAMLVGSVYYIIASVSPDWQFNCVTKIAASDRGVYHGVVDVGVDVDVGVGVGVGVGGGTFLFAGFGGVFRLYRRKTRNAIAPTPMNVIAPPRAKYMVLCGIILNPLTLT